MTLSGQRSALMESTSEVLEAMFFVGVLDECAQTTIENMLCAELTFRGTLSGRFGVGLPLSTGTLIASNFLGKPEEDIREEDIEQVLCELSNMICGSMLSRIESESRFELLHPQILPAGPAADQDMVSSCFELEEGVIAVWMLGRN